MTTLALRGLQNIILLRSGVWTRGDVKVKFIHVEYNICVYTIIYILGQKFRLLFQRVRETCSPRVDTSTPTI